MEIGFIGTGVMGSRMVKRLLEAGHEVTVFNRSLEKAEPLIRLGALRSETVASLACSSDVICTCLSMPNDVLTVYQGPDGIIENAKSSAICIDFTTVGADTSRIIFHKAGEKGISYLDAPVSGGPEGAEQGTLTIMAGGEENVFADVLPILKTIGATVKYLGPSGSGTIAKLINQYLVAVHSVAASEAMVAGAALGLDPELLYKLLSVSYGDSRILRRHMDNFVLDRQFEPGGAVKYVHKDVALANTLFEQTGMTEFSGRFAERSFARAIDQGLADKDMSAVIQPLEKECNIEVNKRR
ncbi:NAD(P)-dependent oxidoreductase [Peribacillus saganii]|uniref:NAD(P)-dependent oxidoreductase n=1 Tax=Peribacillus saganii TaxID=2303992 RepID=A0A372LTN4_9BACI|nr:NAD(P)-dependent oxidoreductase [Peribacillus saganii]RFU70914.1 NAD(P)-dependent oxidoreductase [Peribacillus saganii]